MWIIGASNQSTDHTPWGSWEGRQNKNIRHITPGRTDGMQPLVQVHCRDWPLSSQGNFSGVAATRQKKKRCVNVPLSF